MKKPALSRRLLFGIFTISGFSGLIYESIWSHYLKLFLGHAAYAQTLVLAIFMGGMAFGAWLVARSTLRIRNLLVAYALVELLTGVLALAFHRLYISATAFAFDSAIPALDGAMSIALFKWSLAALLILPQSILLGTTFPLISSGVIRRFPEKSGETLAMLYFTNSLGAALGVLASGFVLISAVGLPGTVMAAGIINILLALFVWVLARGRDVAPAPTPAPVETTMRVSRAILLAAFLAGLAAFVYEIAWIRMLSLVLGSSTHAFELMLSAFILGLALGGFWIRRRISGFVSPLRALSVMFSTMAILAALTLPAYGYAFDVMSTAMKTFNASEAGYAGFNIMSHSIAAMMMIPTTIVAGMTLPLMTHFLLGTGAGEKSIGNVYAANTVGAIAGVLLAIHLLLPQIGTKGAIIAGAAIQLCIALLLLRSESAGLRSPFSKLAIASCAVAVAFLAFTVRLDPMKMASGVYRNGAATIPPDSRVIFLRDGKTATITLAQQGTQIVIATNGKPDAAINMGPGAPQADEITMALAGALPMMLHPAPRRVANIGIGSGLTSHTVLASPKVELLDSVEIEPAVAAAARQGFVPRVSRLFDDPRSHIHFEDAKTFFAATKTPYDVIISEPSNPWVSGVASLFSTEFYGQIKRYIAPGGLLVQWVQIYETDISIVASIMKALAPHFQDYRIYSTDDSDILIIAAVDGPVPPLPESALNSVFAAELREVGIYSLGDIEMRRIGSRKTLEPLIASYPAPRNSDFFPFVDLTAPRMRFLRRDALMLSQLNRQAVPVLELLGEPGLRPGLPHTPGVHILVRQDLAQQALEVRDAFQSEELTRLPINLRQDVLTVNLDATRCALKGANETWLNSVRSIATNTTGNLAAEDLRPVWNKIRASPCFELADETERLWVAYLESLALRDRHGIIEHGSRLLEGPSALSENLRAEIVLAVSASHLGSDDLNSAVKLLQNHAGMIARRRDYDLAIRLVEATAAARVMDGQGVGRQTAH